jgi:acyl-CoA oxidase
LFALQINVCPRNRQDLQGIVHKLENWDYNGHYMLTELGHGLDVINMETTATFTTFSSAEGKVEKGFILHTPSESAQKFMPPSTPMGGMAKV